MELDERRCVALTAALGFAQFPPCAPELQLLHRWLDMWRGIGDIVVLADVVVPLKKERRPGTTGAVVGVAYVSLPGIFTSAGCGRLSP